MIPDLYNVQKLQDNNISFKNDDNKYLETDKDNLSSKSQNYKNPLDLLTKYDKKFDLGIFKRNDSQISVATLKTVFKYKSKELKEYKESLDKKIELLKSKINSKTLNTIHMSLNSSNYDDLKNKKINNEKINNNNKNYKNALTFTLKNNSNVTIDQFKLKDKKSSFSFCGSSVDMETLNYKKFCQTFFNSKNKPLSKFLSLIDSHNLFILFSLNKEIQKNIIEFLKTKIKEKIIPKFITKYSQDTDLFENNFEFILIKKKYTKNKKSYIRFILSIISKINPNNNKIINKKYQITFQIINPKKLSESTLTSYSFEIIPKNIPKKFWIYKEYTSFHYDDHDNAYYNDLMQFWPGDKILISFNIISEIGLIDFENFHWIFPRIIPPLKKKTIDTSYVSYLTNSENTCEVEGIIHSWIDIDQLENSKPVIQTLEDLFGNYFSINEIYYDDVGYYFFKIILQAKNEGQCTGINNNLGIKINVFPKDSIVVNEVKKNGLIYDEKNELNVNIDDLITFYISQNK